MPGNQGANIVYGMAAVTSVLSVGALRAHQHGLEAMRGARQIEDEVLYQNAVEQLISDAEEMRRIAVHLADELAAERSKNLSLKRALEQRQALLENLCRGSD